jgi:hypothetical protein
MGRLVATVCAVLAVGLWVVSGSRNQQGIHNEQSTVQTQLTAMAKATPTATP